KESLCRLCRREGVKLFLKGDRCYTEKCSVERRPYAPGMHGKGRKRFTEYGSQLREKQKLRRIYGILEKQFSRYFKMADNMKGITGHNLLLILERRLDNVVYRLGFANSRQEARQLVSHGHFNINGRRVNIPSYQVKQGDEIVLRSKSQKVERINQSLEAVERRGVPEWFTLDKKKFSAKMNAYPSREQIGVPVQEQLVVELYSK
ncbi:30S ribosomal protein S4, partial [bacterium]|nr:30S ribosomal protein S4 [bacterium]